MQTAVDTLRYLGVALPDGGDALPTGSTDANVGVLQGIPSISVGRSRGGDQHTLQEWTDIESAKIGTKQICYSVGRIGRISGVIDWPTI